MRGERKDWIVFLTKTFEKSPRVKPPPLKNLLITIPMIKNFFFLGCLGWFLPPLPLRNHHQPPHTHICIPKYVYS